MVSMEAGQSVTRGKSQLGGVVVGITQQSFCRDFGGLNSVVEVGLINHSRDMISRFQSTDSVRLEYLLQPLDVLPTELSRLVPLKMQNLEPDTRSASVLDASLRLEPQLLFRGPRSTHAKKKYFS